MGVFVRRLLIVMLFAGCGLSALAGRAKSGMAVASPTMAPPPGFAAESVALPPILSSSDVALYRQIFELGERGDWARVDALIPGLQDRLLVGHVMAQRYLHPKAYRSLFSELKTWMDTYADHPDADEIYPLALRRKPKHAEPTALPIRPPQAYGVSDPLSISLPAIPPGTLGDGKDQNEASTLQRQIRQSLWDGQTMAAKALIQSEKARRLLGPVELDDLGARLGQAYFVDGQDQWALEWAEGAARRSGRYLPEAQWTAGLVAWRLKDFDRAAGHFEALAGRRDLSPWFVSAGAFWAARAYLVANRPQKVNGLLKVAASYPRTFYGILAGRVLGAPMQIQWDSLAAEQAALGALERSPAARRALALLQVGQRERAERELEALAGRGGPDVDRGIIVVANRAGILELSLRLHDRVFPNGGGFDALSYPAPSLAPQGGYAVDRALVYAIIRQESRFNPRATSRAGARGLMQLMPSTARYVARDTPYDVGKRDTLYEPGINLSLGQKYLRMLLGYGQVDGDLFRLAAAWNGGPGNLQDWGQRVDHMNDPLFFIESIPSRETRNFIERVLANLWIYRDRFNQPSPSLDALAAGSWPAYRPLDGNQMRVATHGEN